LLWYWSTSKEKVKSGGALIFGLFLGALPLAIGELKFHFQGLRGILAYGAHQSSNSLLLASKSIDSTIDHLTLLVRHNIIGLMPPLAFLVMLIGGWALVNEWKGMNPLLKRRMQVLVLLFLSSLPMFFVGKELMNFFLVGLSIPLILITSFLIDRLMHKKGLVIGGVLILLLIVSQLKLYRDQTARHEAYVQIQQGVLLSDRMEVLDAIYAQIPLKTPFSVSVFATPYGVRTSWSYYFFSYQRKHDTVIPAWYGFTANGYIGDEIMKVVDKPFPLHVTIIEPFFDVEPSLRSSFMQNQDEHTTLDQQFEINHHLIQIRHAKK
jgi:hypothetical protein